MRNAPLVFLLVLIPALTAAAGQISGTVEYEDKMFSGDPPAYQGSQQLPIRGAVVQLWGSNMSLMLGSGVTDGNGDYIMTITDVGVVDVVLQVHAQTSSGSIEVKTPAQNVHVMEGSITGLDTSAATANNDFAITIADGSGAFNIFDSCYEGYTFIDAVAAAAVPDLDVYWQAGSGTATYYDDTGNKMFIQSPASDPDEFDDAVILHEFGHFVAFELSVDDSPGGPHSLTGHLIPMLAWSEGWATFYSCLVRNNKYYYDAIGGDVMGIVADQEELSEFPLGLESDNEVAVAAVLWDIVDGTGTEADGFNDSLQLDFTATVWDVLENYFTDASLANRNLETFWDGWFARGHGQLAGMEAIFEERGIEYSEDAQEDDDSVSSAGTLTTSSSIHHTYYPAGDEDWVSFPAVKGTLYVIETVNLKNAADTVLELYESDGTPPLAVNDDRSDSDVSSKITGSPAVSGTYSVRSYAYAKGAYTGADTDAWTRYGSYDLKLSSTTSDLPEVSELSVSGSGGTVTVSWTYPAGTYDGVIVAYGTSETPKLGYLDGSYLVVDGTQLYDGVTQTSASTSSAKVTDVFTIWTYRAGYISDVTTNGAKPSNPGGGGGGGGGCFMGGNWGRAYSTFDMDRDRSVNEPVPLRDGR